MRRLLSTLALVLAAISTQPACDAIDDLCHPSTQDAAGRILTAWCKRYVGCDSARGTVEACVTTQSISHGVPSVDTCNGSCEDDPSDCDRSDCDDRKITACQSAATGMTCAEQVSGSLVVFPSGCESCFR